MPQNNREQLLRFFHPGSNVAPGVDLFLRWPTPFILVLGSLDQTIKTRNSRGGQRVLPSTRIPCSFQPLYSARKRVQLGLARLPVPDQSLSSRIVLVDPRMSPYRLLIWWRKSRLVQSSPEVSLWYWKKLRFQASPSSKRELGPPRGRRFVRSCRSRSN